MNSWITQSNRKLVISGNICELYEYEYPVIKGYKSTKKGRANQNQTDKETKKANREKTKYRARQNIRRLVNANAKYMDKFITLTFAKNETDINKANKEYKKFIQRLNYTMKEKIKYITVIEFQKRGAIHYHMLSNIPYIENAELNELWGNGFVKINKIDDIDNVGAYITKYMNKDLNDERLQGKKCYLTSKNLKKSNEILNEEIINELLPQLDIKRIYTKNYITEYNGNVVYTQFVLNRTIEREIAEALDKRYSVVRNLQERIKQSFRTPFGKGVMACSQPSFFEL